MPSELVKNPVYQQLNDLLRGLVRDGEVAPGDQFPTERQISERYGVSRATANKALASLVSEGVLEFRKGVGTFVRAGRLDYDLRHLVSFTQKARAAGKKPATRVLEFCELTGGEIDDAPRDALAVKSDATVFYLERLRLADREPVIYERRYIAAAHCPKLSKSDVRGSLYAAWTEKHKLTIAGADETIRAINLSASQAKVLQVSRGAAGLLVTSTGYLADDVPLWWEETLYRGDAYEFHNRLGSFHSGGPAVGQFLT